MDINTVARIIVAKYDVSVLSQVINGALTEYRNNGVGAMCDFIYDTTGRYLSPDEMTVIGMYVTDLARDGATEVQY